MITVVVPTFNRAPLILKALESVWAQTYGNYELIVVDDGSTDDTRDVLAPYMDKITYLSQKNAGPSVARNNGIKHAQGDYIAFLDSDDEWLPDRLAEMIKPFEKDRRVGIVGSGCYFCSEDGVITRELIERGLTSSSKVKYVEGIRNIYPTSGVLVKTACFQEVGLFDESLRFAEDWDMWLRIIKQHEAAYCPQALVKIRKHGVSLASQNVVYNFMKWEEIIQKHVDGPVKRRKALSWMQLNQAYHCRNGARQKEIKYLLHSIINWPFWFPRRFTVLLKIIAFSCIGWFKTSK